MGGVAGTNVRLLPLPCCKHRDSALAPASKDPLASSGEPPARLRERRLFALDLALWNTSLMLISATTATFLGSSSALWVGLASFFLFRRRMPAAFWAGLLLSLVGMALLAGNGASYRIGFNAGDGLAFGASVFYAAYLLVAEKSRPRVDTVTFMAVSTLSSCALLFVVCL